MTESNPKVPTDTNLDDTNRFMQQLIEKVIKPNAERLAAIILSGGIPIVVFQPKGLARKAARHAGWDGIRPVVRMRPKLQEKLSQHARLRGDHASLNWYRRIDGPGRMFVIAGYGSLLLNYDRHRGYYLEPGSTDAEHLS